MEWYLVLLLILGSLILVMFLGMPVAFSFMLINFLGVFLFWGGLPGFERLVASMARSISIFTLIPIPLFIMLGLVMFRSGMTASMIEALDKWLGRLPGRLSLLSVGAGTLLGAMCGDSMASVAIMGTSMLPEMDKRNYQKPMKLGSVLCTGTLALMIPPSTLGVVLGSLARISIGRILIGIIVPGLILASFYATYIITRCTLQPSLAPPYKVPPVPILEKVIPILRDVLPLMLIIFLVTGVIFIGIATPAEAAATGAFGAIVLAAAYRKLNRKMIRETLISTLEISVMIFMIIVGAVAFSTNLAITGASRGLVEFVSGLPVSPTLILIAMVIIILILGMFMECVGMMMITIPLFMPVVQALGFEPVWWAVIMLLAVSIGPHTPPFGLDMFVLKGVTPPDVSLGDIWRSAIPFVICDLIVLSLIIAFPILPVWLPGLMR